jgi:hypothetical protein
MNGAHDLGGMHGFGPVVIEPDEPVFHAEWERRVFALTLAMGAWRRWNLDMSRHAREQMPPAEYLATSYYEHWLHGLELLLERHGFLSRAELDRRSRAELDRPGREEPGRAHEVDRGAGGEPDPRAAEPARPARGDAGPSAAATERHGAGGTDPRGGEADRQGRGETHRAGQAGRRPRGETAAAAAPAGPGPQPGALRPEGVPRLLQNRRAARLDDPVAPKFKPGDRVVARNVHPVGHTRLPRYVRGRLGVVDRDHGVFIFPDTHAAGLGRKPQHVYSVRFAARELWGPEAPARDAVYVDLWDDYLEAAPP